VGEIEGKVFKVVIPKGRISKNIWVSLLHDLYPLELRALLSGPSKWK
jgi:hypothetical protein